MKLAAFTSTSELFSYDQPAQGFSPFPTKAQFVFQKRLLAQKKYYCAYLKRLHFYVCHGLHFQLSPFFAFGTQHVYRYLHLVLHKNLVHVQVSSFLLFFCFLSLINAMMTIIISQLQPYHNNPRDLYPQIVQYNKRRF